MTTPDDQRLDPAAADRWLPELVSLLADTPAVEAFLDDLVAAAAAELGVSCGMTMRRDARPLTVASSGALAAAADEVQYGKGQGPCLQALATGVACGSAALGLLMDSPAAGGGPILDVAGDPMSAGGRNRGATIRAISQADVDAIRDGLAAWDGDLVGWLDALLFAALTFVPLSLGGRGRLNGDTKVYLYLDPIELMDRARTMWDQAVGGGTVTHQAIGYLWPMGPYYWLTHELGVPSWLAQRWWVAGIQFFAALGVLALLRHLLPRHPAGEVAGPVHHHHGGVGPAAPGGAAARELDPHVEAAHDVVEEALGHGGAHARGRHPRDVGPQRGVDGGCGCGGPRRRPRRGGAGEPTRPHDRCAGAGRAGRHRGEHDRRHPGADRSAIRRRSAGRGPAGADRVDRSYLGAAHRGSGRQRRPTGDGLGRIPRR